MAIHSVFFSILAQSATVMAPRRCVSSVYISVFLGRVLGLFTFGTDSAYRLKSVHRVFDTKRKHDFEIKKDIRFDFLDATTHHFKRSYPSVHPSFSNDK